MSGITMSKELSAMVQVEQALVDLSEDERGRVLSWAGSRFGVALALPKASSSNASKTLPANEEDESQQQVEAANPEEISSLAEFYDLASPSTDSEKVLVVGYWFQYKEGAQELEALKINNQLKHLGHGVSNVSRALEMHKSQKPALMIQKRKEGATKQARKKFVVTNEGKKFVEKMLANAS
jgi:hypothetical protein